MPVPRIRLDLSYDGTGFAGWARQPGLRTVQGALEDGLGVVLRLDPPPRVTVAGRTDAGVHARGQVAHVDVPDECWAAVPGRSDRPPGVALGTRLAGVLPRDVVVHRAGPAPAGFDARFSALRRRYVYRVADDPVRRDPLRRHHVLWHPRPLDVAAMDAAAAPARRAPRLRGVLQAARGGDDDPHAGGVRLGTAADGPDAGLVVATVQADAFCHSMVRALVGASLAVGEGRRASAGRPACSPPAAGTRRGGVVPAHGLTLEEVAYPADDELEVPGPADPRGPRAAGAARPRPSEPCGPDGTRDRLSGRRSAGRGAGVLRSPGV